MCIGPRFHDDDDDDNNNAHVQKKSPLFRRSVTLVSLTFGPLKV